MTGVWESFLNEGRNRVRLGLLRGEIGFEWGVNWVEIGVDWVQIGFVSEVWRGWGFGVSGCE